MQPTTQTAPLTALASPEGITAAVQALLDQAAIRDLGAMYCILRDDNDMEPLLQTFAPDGTFVSGGREITGHDALREWYTGTMRKWAFSHHIPHSHVITLESDTKASGIVTGNVEYGGADTFRVGAYRWYDEYEKLDGRWVFALRHHKWMWASASDDVSTLGRDTLRVRLPTGEAHAAELLPPAV
ncbi:MAG: nuclear transport factor 2 family protein [Solirubrobacteraceae bacterium]